MQEFIPATSPIQPGLTLLEASAGTGKTYSLVRIIIRHLVENDINPDAILTVTFTRAATAEIKSRLQSLLTETLDQLRNPNTPAPNDLVTEWQKKGEDYTTQATHKIALALASFDAIPIFTIDGFFQRLLKEHAFESQVLFTTELEPDDTTLRHTALHDYWRQHVYNLDPLSLALFNTNIKFDDADAFLKEILSAPETILDPDYTVQPETLTQALKTTWSDLAKTLQTHRQDIDTFIANKPAGIKGTSAPFKKGTDVNFLATIDKIIANPATPITDIGTLTNFRASHILTEAAFNKNKYEDLSTHTIAPVFHAIQTYLDSIPENLKSAYLGKIHNFVARRFNQLKSEKNIQSYSDITTTLSTALAANSPAARAMKHAAAFRYQAALIDEFQDTSPQQCSIFLNLFHQENPEQTRYFHIIGDPKQSIYRFRGADVHAYIKASKKANHTYSLLTNYRSTPSAIHATNQLFTQSKDPFITNGEISFTPSKWQGQTSTTPPTPYTALHLHEVEQKTSGNSGPSYTAITRNITEQIRQLLEKNWQEINPNSKNQGPIQPSQIAVLVASGFHATDIQNQLADLNIPASLGTRSSLLESEEAEQVLTLLTALLEPRNSATIRSALLTPALGSGIHIGDDQTFDQITNRFAELHTLWHQTGLLTTIQELLATYQVRQTLLSLKNGLRRITNFLHLIELLDAKARELKLSPAATLQWLESATQGANIDTKSEQLELRISTDADAVQLITQHSCKGLEFPITFVLPSSKNTIDNNRLNHTYHDEKGNTHFAPFRDSEHHSHPTRIQEDQADRARLAYVALTRSIELCHFYYTQPKPKTPEQHALYLMLNQPDTEGLQSIAENSSGTITYNFLEAEPNKEELPPYTPTTLTEPAAALTTRPTENIKITTTRRTTSFTGITRNTPDFFHHIEADLTETEITPPTGFWKTLRGGTSLGLVFHEILEEIDFQNTQNLNALISEKLEKYTPWRERPTDLPTIISQIEANINQLLTHQLTPDLTLADISNNQRLNEANFLLSGQNLSLKPLAKIITQDPPPHLPTTYAKQLETLDPTYLNGFLDGIIDLVFEHNGQYHIIDWKTNQLPNHTPQAIAQSMADHHYYLQYHLYTLALHQFLTARLSNTYDPKKHLGKIHYIYLRAIDPQTPQSGIYTDQLSPTRLAALETAFLKPLNA